MALKLKKLDALQYENFQWLDISFLQRYIQIQISPRGLRALGLFDFLDQDLNLVWLEASQNCTTSRMKLIISQRERMLAQCRADIKDLLLSLQRFRSHPAFSTLEQKMITQVKNTWRLLRPKNKQDILDHLNRVFTWGEATKKRVSYATPSPCSARQLGRYPQVQLYLWHLFPIPLRPEITFHPPIIVLLMSPILSLPPHPNNQKTWHISPTLRYFPYLFPPLLVYSPVPYKNYPIRH